MATKGDGCVKRDVCTFYGCGSTSDLCADCGHYLAEAVKTPTNTGSPKFPLFEEVWNYVNELEVSANGRPYDVIKYVFEQFYDYIERQLRAGA